MRVSHDECFTSIFKTRYNLVFQNKEEDRIWNLENT